jgi:hypothetical protein
MCTLHKILLLSCYLISYLSLRFISNHFMELLNHVLNILCNLNLGCLHPVACVRSGEGGFYPSTQRHYLRLILILILLILLHVSVVRPSSSKNILISRVTQLTTEAYINFDGGIILSVYAT